jgi:hypothetical protein
MVFISRAAIVLSVAALLAEALVAQDSIGPEPLPPTRGTPEPDSQSNLEPVDAEFGKFVRSRWILLDENNGIDGAIGTLDATTGKLNPTDALRIELYDKDAVLREPVTTTDPDGRFRIENLESGMYHLIAKGRKGFLAFNLTVISRGQDVGGRSPDPIVLVQAPRHTQDTLDVVSAAVPPTFKQLNSILQLHYGLRMPSYPSDESPVAIENGEDKTSLLPEAAARLPAVPLLSGNRIRGRMYAMDAENGSPSKVRDVYVHIIRNDRPIGPPIPVNDEGQFEAVLVDGPGAYSIVAAGRDGFGASSFYAQPVVDAEAARPTSVFFVSTQLAQNQPGIGQIPPPVNPAQNVLAGGEYGFTMSLINDPRVLRQAFPAAAGNANQQPPFAAGGAAAGGGGSGGGSGGNLGALLLGGTGLAAGIAALAQDNDPVIQPVPPLASPFFP